MLIGVGYGGGEKTVLEVPVLVLKWLVVGSFQDLAQDFRMLGPLIFRNAAYRYGTILATPRVVEVEIEQGDTAEYGLSADRASDARSEARSALSPHPAAAPSML